MSSTQDDPLVSAPLSTPEEQGTAQPPSSRKIVYLMVFRVGLITLLFGILALVLLLSERPLRLASQYSQAVFTLVILAYACSLAYAALFRLVKHKEQFFAVQVAADVLLVSTLVHLTGGVQSVYSFLFPLLVVEATIVFFARGTLVVTVTVALVYVLVVVGGWVGYIPPVVDQPLLPSQASVEELAQGLVLNLGGQICIAILAAFLARQLRSAAHRVAQQRRTIGDIIRLNANVLQSLQTGLITTDGEGVITSANRAAAKLLGRSENQLAALPIDKVLPQVGSHSSREPIQRFRTNLHPPPGGLDPTPVEVRISPLWDRDRRRSGSLVLLEDLSEISSMEDRVKRAERLAALGRLAAGVAHEIRNPLASVSGSLELLQSMENASEDDRRLLSIALREVDRLASLVTSLLDYARPRPLVHMDLDLLELVTEVVSACEQDPAFEGVRVQVVCPEGGCRAEVDAGQLRQVLWNLLRNAAEAQPEGVLEVELARAPDGTDAVHISVTDSGPGIPAEDMEHIFEPFFTTKAAGSGLGLAIVHRIVEEHGGSVEVASPLAGGSGTRITLRLPDHVPETTPVPGGRLRTEPGEAQDERGARDLPTPLDGAEGDRTPDL